MKRPATITISVSCLAAFFAALIIAGWSNGRMEIVQ